MKMDSSLINRRVALITVIICQLLSQKYHIPSQWAFLLGILLCIVITFVFEIVKRIIGE
jgi:hypothetical protein